MRLKEHQNANKKKMESTVAEHTHHSIHWEVTTMLDHGRGQELLFLQISLFEFLTLLFMLLSLAIEYLWWQCFATTFSSFTVLHKVTNHFQTSLIRLAVAGMIVSSYMLWSVVSSLFLNLKVIKLLRNLILLEDFLADMVVWSCCSCAVSFTIIWGKQIMQSMSLQSCISLDADMVPFWGMQD